MRRIADYLAVPTEYLTWFDLRVGSGRSLSTLRWSSSGDALETGTASFAFAAELAHFIEGLAAGGRRVHFAYVLHLLTLYRWRERPASDDLAVLAHAFEKAGKPLRNAGALSAVLCAYVPEVDDPPDAGELCRVLRSGPLMAELWATDPLRRRGHSVERPPLGSEAFEARIRSALAKLSAADVEHWLRFGRPPLGDAGRKLAERIVRGKPRSLAEVLSALAGRKRFAGAVPYVAQMVSALALPPRRLCPQELPVGGYSDLFTRGQPEQVLPSQFALDSWEFLRRFAENELLYFRREEPPAQTREELVLLVDQGVRTWGDVRLLLSAAVLALGRSAARRHVPLRVSATSVKGKLIDPLTADDKALGELLEASELSEDPAEALTNILAAPGEHGRDIVLLTHPRSLATQALVEAANTVPAGTRLFAVTADAGGQIDLSELRHGTPVGVCRFRVEIAPVPEPEPETVPAKPRTGKRAATVCGWTGDVEPIGFPFRFGVRQSVQAFAMDAAGWLLVASDNGVLHMMNAAGDLEVLPRPMAEGALMTDVQAVVGVAGGFAVGYRHADASVLAHYDRIRGRVKVHALGNVLAAYAQWHYFRDLHCVVAYWRPRKDWPQWGAVDLRTGERQTAEVVDSRSKSRVAEAVKRAGSLVVASPRLPILFRPANGSPSWIGTGLPGLEPPRPLDSHVIFDQAKGRLELRNTQTEWPEFVPTVDGKRLLAGTNLSEAQLAMGTLAIQCGSHSPWERRLHIFRSPPVSVPIEIALDRTTRRGAFGRFMLSPDGRYLALQTSRSGVDIRDLGQGAAIVATAPQGRHHGRLEVALFATTLTASVGNMCHTLEWGDGVLRHRCLEGQAISLLGHAFIVGQARMRAARGMPAAVRYDPTRFVVTKHDELIAVADAHGHLLIFDRANEFVSMFFFFRRQAAGWMPDRTRWGSVALNGCPETPGAAEKFGKALLAASRLGEMAP